MSIQVITRPSLREVVIDALDFTYWHHRGEIGDCADCAKQPAGVCIDHQDDLNRAAECEEARKQIQRSPESPEVLAVLGEAS